VFVTSHGLIMIFFHGDAAMIGDSALDRAAD